MMVLVRFLIIGMFSITALSLFLYQGIEIFHSFQDFFGKHNS